MDEAYGDLRGLSAYLSEFGFSAAPAGAVVPQMDLGVNLSIQAAQYALSLKGVKGKAGKPLVADGAMGPNTSFALDAYTKTNAGKYAGAKWQQQSPSVLWFTPSAFGNTLVAALQLSDKGRQLLAQTAPAPSASAAPEARNAVTGGTQVAIPGKEVMPIRDAQTIVRALGVDIPVDNKWGPATKDGWMFVAREAGVPMDAVDIPGDPYRMIVDVNAASTLRVLARNAKNTRLIPIAKARAELKKPKAAPKLAAPKPASKPAPVKLPAPKPAAKVAPGKSTAPSRSGLVDVNVGIAQEMLIKLGAKMKRDGMFGPGTAAQWRSIATGKRLDGVFDRSGPMNAWVDPKTLAALTQAAGEKLKPAGAAPASAKPKAPAAVKPVTASRAGLVSAQVKAAQDIMVKLGVKMKPDGMYGPGSKSAWSALAKARKLAVEFDRAGPNTAWVDPHTLAALENASKTAKPATPAAAAKSSAEDIAAAEVVKQATVSLTVKTLQQAQLMANAQGSLAGKFAGVRDSGTWDAVTEKGFYTLFGIVDPYAAVWAKALKKLVASNKKSVKVLPNQAQNAGALAKLWVQSKTTPATPAPISPSINPPVADPSGALWQPALAKSTTLASVKLAQQALLELWTLQQEGQIPATPKMPKVAITGYWNTNTDSPAFWLAWGTSIFDGAAASTGDQGEYLRRVLVNTTLSGFGGFGATPSSARGATAIKVPPDVAQNMQTLAAQYIARQTGTPAAPQETATVPLPSAGGAVALDPELITGQAPQPIATPSAQEVAPPSEPAPVQLAPLQIPTQGPDMFAPYQGPITQDPVPTGGPAPIPVIMPQAPDVNVSVNQPTADATLSPGAATTPEPAPASSGGLGLFLGLLAVGTLTVVAMNKNKGKTPAKTPAKKARK